MRLPDFLSGELRKRERMPGSAPSAFLLIGTGATGGAKDLSLQEGTGSRVVSVPRTPGKLSNAHAGPPKKSAQHNLCPSVENPEVRAVFDAYITCSKIHIKQSQQKLKFDLEKQRGRSKWEMGIGS